jgi:hypothetical protein
MGFLETTTLSAVLFIPSSSSEIGIQVFWAIENLGQDWISCLQAGSAYSRLHTSSLPCISDKEMVSPSVSIASQLPDCSAMYQVPEEVLDTRMVARGNSQVSQVLVKWSKMGCDLATWEDKEHLRQ